MDTRKNWIFMDLDDTLGGIEIDGEVRGTSEAYFHAIDRFADRMAQEGFDPELAKKAHHDIDTDLCRRFGFGDKGRFPRSMADTYRHLGGTSAAVAEEVEKIGWGVFEHPYRPLPGAIETVAILGKSYRIAVVTKGENLEQRKKIYDMELFPYVDQIFVLSHKDYDEWEGVFAAIGMDLPRMIRSWAVGNSAKSDVNPPLELGVNGIHLQTESTWSFEHAHYATPQIHRRLEVVSDIRDVLKHVPLN